MENIGLFPVPPTGLVCHDTTLQVQLDFSDFVFEARRSLPTLRSLFPDLTDFDFPKPEAFVAMDRLPLQVRKAMTTIINRRGGLIVPEHAPRSSDFQSPVCLQCIRQVDA
jgi:hypothetical protein